jgi:hypothetical protein
MNLFIFNTIDHFILIILFYLNYSKQSIVNKIFVNKNSVKDLLAKLSLLFCFI